MKFIYVDESGNLNDPDQSDVFVMCGLMVDAYKLRKKTADLDSLFKDRTCGHLGRGKEIKTKQFIEGKDGWSKRMPGDERKNFIEDVCKCAVDGGGKLFGIGLSSATFDVAKNAGHGQPFEDHWVASSMFIGALVQKKMQKDEKNKGSTVIIIDDNRKDMPELSDVLYNADPWYDPLYQVRGKKGGASVWIARKPEDRFDQIINTAFAINSVHSTLVQVSDVICYVYRRHLELKDPSMKEEYLGEKTFYEGLIAILEPNREKLGQTPTGKSVDFYKAACHPHWKI